MDFPINYRAFIWILKKKNQPILGFFNKVVWTNFQIVSQDFCWIKEARDLSIMFAKYESSKDSARICWPGWTFFQEEVYAKRMIIMVHVRKWYVSLKLKLVLFYSSIQLCSCRRCSNLRQSSHTCEWNYMPLPLCIPASIIIYLCSKPNKVFSSNTDVYWLSFKTRDTGTKVVYQITDLQNICNVMSWHGMACPVLSCHVMSCHVM